MRRPARTPAMICLIAGVVLAAGAAGCAPEARYECRRVGPVRWGPPDNGLQAGLVAQTWRKVGDPSFPSPPGSCLLVVRNVGDRGVSMLELNRWCTATRDRSRSLADLHVVPLGGGDEARTFVNVVPQPEVAYVVRTLAPGEEYAFDFDARFLCDAIGPEADLVMTYHNDERTVRGTTFDPGPRAVAVDHVWTGAIRTGPLRVRLDPQEPKSAGPRRGAEHRAAAAARRKGNL